jgi:hypothetical protein
LCSEGDEKGGEKPAITDTRYIITHATKSNLAALLSLGQRLTKNRYYNITLRKKNLSVLTGDKRSGVQYHAPRVRNV